MKREKVMCGKGRGLGEVQSISEKTQSEDCRGEGIAGQTGIAIEQLRKEFVMIFWI